MPPSYLCKACSSADCETSVVGWKTQVQTNVLCLMQVQHDYLYIGIRVRCWHSIRMLLIGPANKMSCAVLVPGSAVDKRNGRQLLNHDLLYASQRLLLHGRVG